MLAFPNFSFLTENNEDNKFEVSKASTVQNTPTLFDKAKNILYIINNHTFTFIQTVTIIHQDITITRS